MRSEQDNATAQWLRARGFKGNQYMDKFQMEERARLLTKIGILEEELERAYEARNIPEVNRLNLKLEAMRLRLKGQWGKPIHRQLKVNISI